MKKIIALALASLNFVPLSSMAISLAELQDNPIRYTRVCEDSKSTTYIDNETIKSLRYTPPFYTLSANAYIVMYTNNLIIGTTYTTNYDYNQSAPSVVARIEKEYPNFTKQQVKEKSVLELWSNSGMVSSTSELSGWDLEGKFLMTDKGASNMEVKIGTAPYHVSNYVFYKYYEEYFNPNISTKNLKCFY